MLLAFELGLYESLARVEAAPQWKAACDDASRAAKSSPHGSQTEARVLLQCAFEAGFRKKLIARVNSCTTTGRSAPSTAAAAAAAAAEELSRPKAQAVFCIDVRSEVLRRHLEAADGAIENLGFAGFFGFPVEHIQIGHQEGSAQCPVLLAPTHRVTESAQGDESSRQALKRRVERHTVRRAWQSFKMGAISCFSFVGPIGLSYLPKLFTDGAGFSRPVPHPSSENLGQLARQRSVDLREGTAGGQQQGIPPKERIELAAGALRGMSLTHGFARLVALVGHGSTTVNNPHASGLDCGACGGRTGEANVCVAVEILNDPDVRKGLEKKDIAIPKDTVFGHHDRRGHGANARRCSPVAPHRARAPRTEPGLSLKDVSPRAGASSACRAGQRRQ